MKAKRSTKSRILATLLSVSLLLGTASSSIATAATAQAASGTTEIVNLRTNSRVKPMEIDTLPVFRWAMESNVVGQGQSAYQIVVTDENKEIVWDSGKVLSEDSQEIKYEGKALEPGSEYSWKVTVYGRSNRALETKETSL